MSVKTKKVTTTTEVPIATCDGCGVETPTWNIIDNWCIQDGKDYCRACQRKKEIGWYEPKK